MNKQCLAFIVLFFALPILFFSCQQEPIYYPKPRSFPKFTLPQRTYSNFDVQYCNFSFQYPDYMKFEQDTLFINQNTKHACWFNLHMPALNADIHFTYTDISGDSLSKKIFKVYRDAYKMSEEHNPKSSLTEDLTINKKNKKVFGVLYNIEGYVASPFQFVLTDSSQHALRASLYFRNRPNPDSLLPIIEFVKTDMMNILNSFEWKQR
jgi:gliding motility-associated lipoprotein GldD